MTPEHQALRKAVTDHIAEDDAAHASLLSALEAHSAADTTQDHTDLIAKAKEHIDATKASHDALIAAVDQHISEEP